MKKVTILLLLIVQAFGKNPYPDHIKKKFTYDPSIPVSRSAGTTILKPNDVKLVRVVDFLIDHLNSQLVNQEGDMLKLQETGKVELKVIDERRRMPHQRYRFIKNIYTFEKLMCINRDGNFRVNMHGSVSFIFDQEETFLKDYIFVNVVIRNSTIPLKERIRRHSISGDINNTNNNQNSQRRPSLNLEMDRHRNRRV